MPGSALVEGAGSAGRAARRGLGARAVSPSVHAKPGLGGLSGLLDAARIRVPGQSSTRALSLPTWEGWGWSVERRVGSRRGGGSRPAQAGGAPLGTGPSSSGGGQCSVIAGGARGAASGPSPVASPGARWSCLGRENKTGPTPVRAPCDRMSQARLRTCLRRHCLRGLVKWPGARERVATNSLVIAVSAIGAPVENVSQRHRLA